MRSKPKWLMALVLSAAIVLIVFWQPAPGTQLLSPAPESKHPPGPHPRQLLEKRASLKAPELRGRGSEARRAAMAFLKWAANSTAEESEGIRGMLAGARENADIAQAFCDEAFRARAIDHSQALVALALLGEMKNPAGETCFARFTALPLPERGTVVEGEILEQVALATLQAKAVDGLAFLGTPRAKELVLKLAGSHPSRIVRAEAIDAYLWNHSDSEEAKATLRRYVKKEELIFVDRVRRNSGETAESFNPKLEMFLKAHPELIPPAPEKLKDIPSRPGVQEPELPDPPKL